METGTVLIYKKRLTSTPILLGVLITESSVRYTMRAVHEYVEYAIVEELEKSWGVI